MKNTIKFLGIIALVAVIGFSMVACDGLFGDEEGGDPALTGTVTITGTATVGQMLTANITNLDGTGTVSYQWKRGDTASATGTNISGATSSTYTLVTADLGKYITVTVTRAGYSGSKTSMATAAVVGTPTALPASYHGTWVSTEGTYVRYTYTLTVSADTVRWEDEAGGFIQYTNVQFIPAVNTNGTYSAQYPSGYTLTGTRTAQGYQETNSNRFGFIALSTDGQSVYMGTSAATEMGVLGGPIFTKQNQNSAFIGKWKPLLKENDEEDTGFYIFSNDGTYEMSALVDTTNSLIKGTWTTTGTTDGDYTLTPTHINGTLLLEFIGTNMNDSLFKTKLESKWYTAEEYAAMVLNFVEVEVPAALAAETAIRYAEIDADETLTPEEKATAKEWVDFELGLTYTFGEILLPMITVALTMPTPGVYDDPALNGTATYALTSSNTRLTLTSVTKSKDSETGVITSSTGTTRLKKVN
jgi:hypothetical protein